MLNHSGLQTTPLLRIPLDVLVEVTSYFIPRDILILARTAKAFRVALCTADYRNLWRRLYQRDLSAIALKPGVTSGDAPASARDVARAGAITNQSYYREYGWIMVHLQDLASCTDSRLAGIRYAATEGYEQLLRILLGDKRHVGVPFLEVFPRTDLGLYLTLAGRSMTEHPHRHVYATLLDIIDRWRKMPTEDDFAATRRVASEEMVLSFMEKLLTSVSRCGFLDLVERITQGRGSDIALFGAAFGGHRPIVERMLALGATDINNALAWAAEGGHLELVEFFIAKGGNSFDVVLVSAAAGGHLHIVQSMFDRGVAGDLDGALVAAADHGHPEIAEFLIGRGATNFVEAAEATLYAGNLAMIQLLMLHEPNLTVLFPDAQRSFIYTVTRGHLSVVQFLLEHLVLPPEIPLEGIAEAESMIETVGAVELTPDTTRYSSLLGDIPSMNKNNFLAIIDYLKSVTQPADGPKADA